jgi:hypothetical protein
MTQQRERTTVTGRDGYIVRQALAYFIAVHDALPKSHQQISNQADAFAILLAGGSFAEELLSEARHAVAVLQDPALEDVKYDQVQRKRDLEAAGQRIERYKADEADAAAHQDAVGHLATGKEG